MKLNEDIVAGIKCPPDKNEIAVFDDDLPGFGVRAYISGRNVYFVKYEHQGKQRKITLGKVVRGMLASQRKRAGEVLARARLGQDTSAERQVAKAKQTATLGELIPRYLDACEPSHKPRTFIEKKRHLLHHWSGLHALNIEDVTRRGIVVEIDRIADTSGPIAADRAKASLSAFFAWCVGRNYVDANPVGNISKRGTNGSRDRVLSEGDLVQIWQACGDDWEYGRIVRLLILTGQRREEIGGLMWPEVNFDKSRIELPPSRTKNKQHHLIPLSAEALTILKAIPKWAGRDLVFGSGAGGYSGWSNSKHALDARLPGTAAWRLHDLRRTFVTMISEQGFAPPHVVEALVNHISGHKAGVAGVYNRATYAAEKRQAMDLWDNHINSLVLGNTSNVIAIQRH